MQKKAINVYQFYFFFAIAENQNFFTKKKTEKKESHLTGGGAKKLKGNGISPEGWQGNEKTRRSHHKYLAIMPQSFGFFIERGHCAEPPTFACLFVLFSFGKCPMTSFYSFDKSTLSVDNGAKNKAYHYLKREKKARM